VGHFTDDRGAGPLLFNRGYQVLHPLRNSTGQGSNSRRQRERVEWCRRVAASARACWRNEGAAGAVGAKFRPGFRGYQDTSLGQAALISCRLSPSGLPSLHRKSAFRAQASNPGLFFRLHLYIFLNTRLIIVSSKLGGTRLDSSMGRWWGSSVRNSTGGRGGLHR
jgi:hypothetical protein